MLRSIALMAMFVAAPLSAQEIRNAVVPHIGDQAVASVGDTVYEKSHLSVLPAYTINEFFSGKSMFLIVTISPGDKFIKIASKSFLKACRSPSIEAFVHKSMMLACMTTTAMVRLIATAGTKWWAGKSCRIPFLTKLPNSSRQHKTR